MVSQALQVLHKRRLKAEPATEEEAQQLIEAMNEENMLYASPFGSNDDWYWLYAAVKAGVQPPFHGCTLSCCRTTLLASQDTRVGWSKHMLLSVHSQFGKGGSSGKGYCAKIRWSVLPLYFVWRGSLVSGTRSKLCSCFAGSSALLVSNDEMRDHIFQLLAPKYFLKWKQRHQVC